MSFFEVKLRLTTLICVWVTIDHDEFLCDSGSKLLIPVVICRSLAVVSVSQKPEKFDNQS